MRIQHAARASKQPAALCALGLALLLALFLSACNGTASSGASSGTVDSGQLKIVASIFAPYDFARTIVDNEADVSMLVPPGAETHSFEPTPADIIMLNEADVLIYVGGESDAWLEKIIASLDNPDLVLIQLTDLVDAVFEETLEGMDTSGEEAADPAADADAAADEQNTREIDEHVWTSLRNAQVIVSSLAESFSTLDAEHAKTYIKNAEAYNAQLASLDERISTIVENGQRTTLVFGDRFPFRYFADDYGLECYAAFPGCSTAVDTSPKTITFLINKVVDEDIPVVFFRELSDERIAHTIAEETGAQTLCLHSAHNISKDDMAAGATYLSLMEQNALNLEVALS